MSRSNPTDNTPNPSTRWFEWNGELGTVRYYDKDAKKNVDVGTDFSFLLLDQLATVQGWHERSGSGIYANEVRDTRQDVLVVKAFKGGTLAEGLYANIKDRINTLGGQFVANCYIAYKRGDELVIGSIRFKGAALNAWMEFTKAHRAELYEKAVQITGYTEGKKGRIIFRAPTFALKALSPASNSIAVALDKELQKYLDAYMKRTTKEKVEAPTTPTAHPADDDYVHDDAPEPDITPSEDDIPF